MGGTSLRLPSNGTIANEVAWAGSGGGRSLLFPRPAWQVAPAAAVGHDRLVPDVCAAANPNTGAFLILQGKPLGIGGTSWAAPVWAALCALINQARTGAGQPALGYLHPQLYPLTESTAFRDVQVGSNGAYAAGPGHDLVTGLGSPDLAELLGALARTAGQVEKTEPSTQPRRLLREWTDTVRW